jgi:hypothetical protein
MPGRGQGNVAVAGQQPSRTDPVAAKIHLAARRLVAELANPAGGSPTDAMAAARELSRVTDVALRAAVDRARAAGQSWSRIGEVLGTTRQAAFQRFGRPADPRTGPPMVRAAAPELAERAVALLDCFVTGRWEKARQEFTEVLRGHLDAEYLARGWAQTAAQMGRCERLGEPFAYRVGADTAVDIPVYFEAGDRTGRVVFDRDGQVAGLFLRPHPGP